VLVGRPESVFPKGLCSGIILIQFGVDAFRFHFDYLELFRFEKSPSDFAVRFVKEAEVWVAETVLRCAEIAAGSNFDNACCASSRDVLVRLASFLVFSPLC